MNEALRKELYGVLKCTAHIPVEQKRQSKADTQLPRNPRGGRGVSQPIHRKGGLNIISWNTDRRLGKTVTLGALVQYLHGHNIDVACLQETGDLHLNKSELEKWGYNAYTHGKVAILVSRSAAERRHAAGLMWKSPSHDSMTITLLTPEGSLLIGSAYVQHGVDDMIEGSPERENVLSQHMELAARAMAHTYAVVGMDANETTHTWGRVIQDPPSAGGRIRPSPSSQGNSLGKSTMACYAHNMRDCDQSANPSSYSPSGRPLAQAYTHQQPLKEEINTGKTLSRVKLDILWVSKNMIGSLEHV